MSNIAGPSKADENATFDDNEFLEDSLFMANFVDSTFKETSRISESHINESINKSNLNVSALCCDEEINGYDKLTGQTWIYPTNYPVRDYQFNIIKAAILQNTLVSLPTGLGKTFIAAVIMYNFYRWYPLGKIVFTAPTRPLVAQQIEACYNIIAIPPNDTIEMTGHMQVNTRKTHWQSKRVFFATPQVIYNDIMSGICPGDKIRCLVIDEAHRARGHYAYCQIVGSLTDQGHKTFRILALSATPGSKVDDVINVVKNLHIAHLELRSENCIDVAPYSHSRKINTVVVQLGPELAQLRQQYIEILDGYARRLKQCNILPHNLGNLSKGRVVMLYKEYQNKDRSARHPQHNYIMKDFTILIALYHGLELLIKHGSRVFLNFFDEHPEKSWMQADDRLTAMLERLRDDLGVNPLSLNRSVLPDGTIPELPKDLCFGHPKFIKLKEIMMEHFVKSKENGQDTRAIVFCEYRESVNLVHCLLLQCRPLITPQMFVGQGASGKDGKTVISQKQQLRVMRSFREGACNTLVATCVAEEGLDVGSVDLIVCFDISSRSPIRLVQRCGRTGRERGGQVYILVTEGREHQTLLDCMRQRDGLNKKILQSREVESNLYKNNPRMVPHDFVPKCQKMYITVAKKHDPKEKETIEKAKKGQKDLRSMLLGKASSASSSSSSKEFEVNNLISEEEFNKMFPTGFHTTTKLAENMEYWAMSKDRIESLVKTTNKNEIKLHSWLEWQRSLQKTVNIDHSTDSEMLVSLLRYSDAKRFDMPPSTQNPVFHSQEPATQNIITASPAKPKQAKKKPVTKPFSTKSPGKKDGDIRALFSTATKSTKSYTKLINDLGIQNNGDLPTQLINLLVDLSLDNSSTTKTCYICQRICDCSLITKIRQQRKIPPVSATFLTEPKFPNIDLLDDIDTNSLLNYHKSEQQSENVNNQSIEKYSFTGVDENCSGNFDLEFDFNSLEHDELLKKNENISLKENVTHENFNTSNFDLEFEIHSPDNELVPSKTCTENVETNFEIGDIEDVFAESSPEENIQKEIIKIENDPKEIKNVEGEDNIAKNEEILGFFGLDSIDDIFAEDDSINNKHNEEPLDSKRNEEIVQNKEIVNGETIPDIEYPGSPSILSGRQNPKIVPTSPILCSQVKKYQLSTKKNRAHSTPNNDNRSAFINPRNSIADTSDKSMFTITQLVEMINKTDNTTSTHNLNKTEERKNIELAGEKSNSPILLTQADKQRLNLSNRSKPCIPPTKSGSLIVLDSDSDSDDNTQIYEVDDKLLSTTQKTDIKSNNDECLNRLSSTTSKRKLDFDDDDILTLSPYFNKKQKFNNNTFKPLTLQEKVLAALTSNKVSDASPKNNDSDVKFFISPLKSFSQKENFNPQCDINKTSFTNSDDEKEYVRRKNFDMLQMFRRDSKVKSPKNKLNMILKDIPSKVEVNQKRRLSFDSDDDFVSDEKNRRSPRTVNGSVRDTSITNHKVRKKKKSKPNDFLELEAEQSAESGDSGDELTDDSTGSLVDFICDDNTQTQHNDDMHAQYLRSVKSPVNGMFKIPQLPNKFDKKQIFSQFVEDDAYEMDSFCVDSHIDLTQANDMSELELAEKILEEKRRSKKTKFNKKSTEDNGDSPIVKRKNKNVCRIQSDSDDSS